MDAKKLGKQIQAIRENSGWSQEAVEKALQLQQEALTHIEAGTRNVSSLELSNLADLFHVPIGDFFDEALCPAASSIEQNPEIARYIHICREGAFLEQLLQVPRQHTMFSHPFSVPQILDEAISQAEEAVAHLAIEAYRREEISRGRLLELSKLLQLPGDTLLRMAEEAS